MKTSLPSLAMWTAIPRPIPVEPPVTRIDTSAAELVVELLADLAYDADAELLDEFAAVDPHGRELGRALGLFVGALVIEQKLRDPIVGGRRALQALVHACGDEPFQPRDLGGLRTMAVEVDVLERRDVSRVGGCGPV